MLIHFLLDTPALRNHLKRILVSLVDQCYILHYSILPIFSLQIAQDIFFMVLMQAHRDA